MGYVDFIWIANIPLSILSDKIIYERGSKTIGLNICRSHGRFHLPCPALAHVQSCYGSFSVRVFRYSKSKLILVKLRRHWSEGASKGGNIQKTFFWSTPPYLFKIYGSTLPVKVNKF